MDETVRFEWDEAKAAANLSKHGVRFEVASGVFRDPACLTEPSGEDRYGGARWRSVGWTDGRLVTVVHTRRGHLMRVISARPASRKEARLYGDR